MRRLLSCLLVATVLVMSSGCGSRNVEVTLNSESLSHTLPVKLDKWKGRATKDVVRSDLGAPTANLPGAGGGTQWQYRITNRDGNTCWHYMLAFDQQDVLRSWTRERC